MKSTFTKFLSYSFIILLIALTYLTFIGIETDKFNDKIQKEISEKNNKLNVELNKIKILLSPFDLKIKIKTLGTNIIFDQKKIELESINSKISLINFINNQFSIDNLKVSTKLIKVKDLISLLRKFNNTAELFIFEKFTKAGYLIADMELNFDEKGFVNDDYHIQGNIKDGKFNFSKKYNFDNLDFNFVIKKDNFFFENIKLTLNNIYLLSNSINIIKSNNEFFVKGEISSKDQDFTKENLLILKFNSFKNYNLEKLNLSSKNTFSFKIGKKFKLRDLNLISEINLNQLSYSHKFDLKKYFPKIKETIDLKGHKIKFITNKSEFKIEGSGDLILQNNKDKITYIIDKKNDNYIFKVLIDILNNPILMKTIKYSKKDSSNAKFNLEGIYKKDKSLQFKTINFKENINEFKIKDLILNKNLRISKLDEINLSFKNNDSNSNDLKIKRQNKDYLIKGEIFDADELINIILNSDNNDGLSKLLDIDETKININIKKVFLDKDNYVNQLNGQFLIKKSDIKKMNLNSFYSTNEKLTLSINQLDDKKITTLFSARAKPFVKKYKFVKGFEEGSLDFYSIKENKKSISKLKIYDFKLQELPALTKLLTLASLQGIADLLSGEGIRFTEFEMNFTNEGSLMTIDEIYSIGPAISLLMEGYVEKNKIISLRGTLVPATTINKAIGSIPLLGNILVGKKAGEGVFGVSFKIKGPPKKLETSVNPIKTLTPRFITRTLEKIKKN